MGTASHIALVFLGGGLGSVARYGLSGVVYRFLGTAFPYGTLTVNILGCFLIGLIFLGLEERWATVGPSFRLLVAIGMLGGFTTFSSFTYETVALIRDGEFLYALLNVAANMLVCLAATFAGLWLGKLL